MLKHLAKPEPDTADVAQPLPHCPLDLLPSLVLPYSTLGREERGKDTLVVRTDTGWSPVIIIVNPISQVLDAPPASYLGPPTSGT